MKFLHSPSNSSSSTANYTPAGCIPAILRRLLCFHTLPTFALDNHIQQQSYGSNEFDELYCANKLNGSPGIVAKLMGLDTMPVERELKLQKKGNSLLKAPSFVELENEKFIILSFEGGGKDKELQLNSSKTQTGLIESKEKERNRMNQEMPICQNPVVHDEVMNSCKFSKLGMKSEKSGYMEGAKRGISKKKKIEKGEIESDSENSSPVSVLEFSDHQEASYSEKEDLKSKSSTSRRKLRGDLDKNAASPSSSSSSSLSPVDDGEESCRNGEVYVGLGKKNFVSGECKEMWEEICKMAERDVMDSSRVQMERWKGEDFEDIGVCFELQILDQLIIELFTIT